MTALIQRDAHDGSTHTCGVDLSGQGDYPDATLGGWDTCREVEWTLFCEDVDATAEADELHAQLTEGVRPSTITSASSQ